jgi:hypothetical protein
MNDTTTSSEAPESSTPPRYRNADAPFIVFDVVAAYGVAGGMIELELAARTIYPTPDGSELKAELVCTGRLRCSPAATVALGESAAAALRLLREVASEARGNPPESTEAAGRLN